MSSVLFAAVADDDTGATDLGGMLHERGVRTIVVFDGCAPEQLAAWSADVDGIIIGIASRSSARRNAFDRTRDAIELLKPLNPRVFFLKYCSTFDSTPQGNIGASIEAALAACGEKFTIALPALPVLGRTTYQGHHFVGRQLLSESPMRDHPLNPMRNPDLVSHLSSQTNLRVDLASYASVTAGPPALSRRLAELSDEGVAIAIVDCITQSDIATIADASVDLRLLTGSSALGTELPDLWARKGWWKPPAAPLPAPCRDLGGRGFLIAAGSCSVATRAQNHFLKADGCVAVPVDPVSLGTNAEPPPEIVSRIREALERRMTCLIETTSTLANDAVRGWASQIGLTAEEAGERISMGLGRLVQEVLDRVRPEGLVIAGGETSSTICRMLRLGAITVGPEIQPGVPVCVSLDSPRLPVVLKSGNFGNRDFYSRAIHAIRKLPYTQHAKDSRGSL